jgi:hypothetical protein
MPMLLTTMSTRKLAHQLGAAGGTGEIGRDAPNGRTG